jgi:hypothetical protein
MHELILAIQQQLRSSLTYIREANIYVAPHIGYIPDTVNPPCIGIKDGSISRVETMGEMLNVTLRVSLVVYVRLLKSGAGVMGDSSINQKGVLEIAQDIHAALDENLLSIDGMQAAMVVTPEPESELFGDEVNLLQRKIITYEYEKEETRP